MNDDTWDASDDADCEEDRERGLPDAFQLCDLFNLPYTFALPESKGA